MAVEIFLIRSCLIRRNGLLYDAGIQEKLQNADVKHAVIVVPVLVNVVATMILGKKSPVSEKSL